MFRCNLLRLMFFVPFDNWKTLFFLKVCRYCVIFSTARLSFSLKQVFWKKSVFHVTSRIIEQQCSANTNDNAKFPNKAIVYYTLLKDFPSFFTLLFYDCSTLFFINEFFWKNQNISESPFLHNNTMYIEHF